MERVLLKEWDRITTEDYRKCIVSMPKRVELVYRNTGGSTNIEIGDMRKCI